MSETKARLIGAITVMDEEKAEKLWNIIEDMYSDWDRIEEVEPDEIDLQMIEEIKADPDCHEFVPEAEAKTLLGI